MKARAALTSTRKGTSNPPRDITSVVTREGDIVEVNASNDIGDTLFVQMTGDGEIIVRVTRGESVKDINLAPPRRMMRQDAKAEMAGGYPY